MVTVEVRIADVCSVVREHGVRLATSSISTKKSSRKGAKAQRYQQEFDGIRARSTFAALRLCVSFSFLIWRSQGACAASAPHQIEQRRRGLATLAAVFSATTHSQDFFH
jgi:hypothetical protein